METRKAPQGSFGIPEDMMEAIKKAKTKTNQEPNKEYFDSESIPEAAEIGTLESPEKDKPEKEDAKEKDEETLAKELEKALGIEISHDDIFSMVFYNKLEKEVNIIPNMMSARFRALSVEDMESINAQLAEALELKLLESGFRALQVKFILSRGLVALGAPGKTKALGTTPDEVIKSLGKLNSIALEKISQKWNSFAWLVDYRVRQEMELKNS